MVAQLSTSGGDTQLTMCRVLTVGAIVVCVLFALLWTPQTTAQDSAWQQPADVEIRIEPLSAIDQQFMAEQRARVESLANQLGRRLTGTPARDLDTLDTLLERNIIARDDRLTLQALGVTLGDLLADALNMEWVVYRDRAGRSRALQYGNEAIYLFPVTMISRRYEAGSQRSVADLYRQIVTDTQKRLPGARWRQ